MFLVLWFHAFEKTQTGMSAEVTGVTIRSRRLLRDGCRFVVRVRNRPWAFPGVGVVSTLGILSDGRKLPGFRSLTPGGRCVGTVTGPRSIFAEWLSRPNVLEVKTRVPLLGRKQQCSTWGTRKFHHGYDCSWFRLYFFWGLLRAFLVVIPSWLPRWKNTENRRSNKSLSHSSQKCI